jgi:hypothetical protein
VRDDNQSRRSLEAEEPFEVLVFSGDDSRALIDINDHRALEEVEAGRHHSD